MRYKKTMAAVALCLTLSGAYMYASADGGYHSYANCGPSYHDNYRCDRGYENGDGRGYAWGLDQAVLDGELTKEQAASLKDSMKAAHEEGFQKMAAFQEERQKALEEAARKAGVPEEAAADYFHSRHGRYCENNDAASLTAEQKAALDEGMADFRKKHQGERKAFRDDMRNAMKAAADKAGISEEKLLDLCEEYGFGPGRHHSRNGWRGPHHMMDW